MFRGKRVIYKQFVRQKEYQREMKGNVIARSDRHRCYITPFINGHTLQDLTPSFIKTIAHMHNQGLLQADAHLGNFMVDTEQTIHVLDPGSIRSFHTENEALDNLALIYAQWNRDLDETHLALLPLYVETRGQVWSDAFKKDFLKRLENAREYRLRKCLSKACRGSTRYYAKIRHYVCIFAKREFANVYAQTLMRFPESFFNNTTVARANIGKTDVVIKRYPCESILQLLKNIVQSSEARRAWKNIAFLNCIGIKTPEPLAMIEKRFFYIPLTSYMVMQYVAGQTLDKIDLKSLPENIHEKVTLQMERCNMLLTLSHVDATQFSSSDWLWDGDNIYLINFKGVI
jgi:tRNA A-37 threonylcarbamoyl transferase component Bud32